MSYCHFSRRRSGSLATTVWAAKLAFASGALAAIVALGRLAVPQLVSAAGAFFPRAWAAARLWLVPPYLFVTVHLIILVIWKLSDHRHLPGHHKDPWANNPPPTPVVVPAADEATPAVKTKEFGTTYDETPASETSPEIPPDSGAGESCVTTESDEDASSAPSHAVLKWSLAPQLESAILERELSPPPAAVTATADDGRDDDDDDDDMDATWKAIMEKTRQAGASPPPARARDPSLGKKEMDKRFDDFIKKNRHSFGRH